jgi:hypothetical protein
MCGHSCTSEKFGWQAAISKDLLSVQQAIFNVTWQEKTAYNNCGRRLWKLTADTQGFVLRSLRRMRKQGMCTTKSLQAELALV